MKKVSTHKTIHALEIKLLETHDYVVRLYFLSLYALQTSRIGRVVVSDARNRITDPLLHIKP